MKLHRDLTINQRSAMSSSRTGWRVALTQEGGLFAGIGRSR